MPLGFHFRLALVHLTFLSFIETQHFPAVQPIARSTNAINEDKTATEELKYMDNIHNVYPSSQHRSEPLFNYSERAASLNVSADSVWSRKPLERLITSPASSKQNRLSFVSPYPVSGGTTSSRSAKWTMRVNNSNKAPQRFGTDEGGHSVGQYKDHVTGLNPLPDNQTSGDGQLDGRKISLAKSTIKVNEGGSIVRGIWHQIKPLENVSLSLVRTKPIISYPAEHLGVTAPSRRPLLQPRFQLQSGAFLQEPWRQNKDFVSNVQASNAAQFNQGQQVLAERGTTQQRDQAINLKPANLVRVRPGHASEVLHLLENTINNIHYQDTKGQDQFHNIHKTSKSKPLVTHLPTSSSVTCRGVMCQPHVTSTVVQSYNTLDLSQSRPNSASTASQIDGGTVSTTSASQPAFRYLDALKMAGESRFLGRGPVTVSSSNHMSQSNVDRHGVLENAEKARKVQWLVMKPYSASNSTWETVHLSSGKQSSSLSKQNQADSTRSTNFYAIRDYKFFSQIQTPQMTVKQSNAQMQKRPHSVPNVLQYITRGKGSIDHSIRSKDKALLESPNREDWRATVSSLEGASGKQLYPLTNNTQYRIKVLANLDLKKRFEEPGQRNRSIFFRPTTLHDLWVKENDQNSKLVSTYPGKTPRPSISALNSSLIEDAKGGGQTIAANSYSPQEMTGHKTLSSGFRPQMATEEYNPPVSEILTPQDRIRHSQTTKMAGLPLPNKTLHSLVDVPLLNLPEEQAKIVQQSNGYFNASQISRPTSTVVVVAKRMKASPKDKSTVFQKTFGNSQLPIYRTAIIRRKSKNKLLVNISKDLSNDDSKPESHGMVNQSSEMKVQTESSPSETKGDTSISDLTVNLTSTNLSVTNPVRSIHAEQSLNSSRSKLKQIKPLLIKYLDVASSAAISIHKSARAGPVLNGTERYSNSNSLTKSTIVPTTTEVIAATARDDVTESRHV